jgi:hypothetical protein
MMKTSINAGKSTGVRTAKRTANTIGIPKETMSRIKIFMPLNLVFYLTTCLDIRASPAFPIPIELR